MLTGSVSSCSADSRLFAFHFFQKRAFEDSIRSLSPAWCRVCHQCWGGWTECVSMVSWHGYVSIAVLVREFRCTASTFIQLSHTLWQLAAKMERCRCGTWDRINTLSHCSPLTRLTVRASALMSVCHCVCVSVCWLIKLIFYVMFAISSPDEFLYVMAVSTAVMTQTWDSVVV